MSGIAISFLVSVFSIRMLMDGREVESLYGLSMSIPYITYALGILLGTEADMTPMILVAVAEVAAAFMFMDRRDYILTASGLVSGSLIGVGIFSGVPELCWLSGLIFSVLTISRGIVGLIGNGERKDPQTTA